MEGLGAEQDRENSGECWQQKLVSCTNCTESSGYLYKGVFGQKVERMFTVMKQFKVFVGRGGDVAIPGFFVIRWQGPWAKCGWYL